MRPDPPIRADGRCALPGCRRLRDPDKSRKYGGPAADLDPFCSAPCARAWHGTAIVEQPAKANGAAADRVRFGDSTPRPPTA